MEVKKSNKHTLFNPAFIDDYGFTAEEFRVFARIMRRSLGNEKGCFESIPQMAESLVISEHLVRRALNVLVKCNAITRTERAGKSDVLDFRSCEEWKPSALLPAIRNEFDAARKQKDRERKAAKKSLVVMETTGVSGYGNDRGSGYGNDRGSGYGNDTGVVMETTGEGIIDKSIISQQGNHKKVKSAETAPTAAAATALSIYREFFPAYKLTVYQEQLLAAVTERLDIFRQSAEFWATNGYQERNVFGLLDHFRQKKQKTPPPLPSPKELPVDRFAEMERRGFPKMGVAPSC